MHENGTLIETRLLRVDRRGYCSKRKLQTARVDHDGAEHDTGLAMASVSGAVDESFLRKPTFVECTPATPQ